MPIMLKADHPAFAVLQKEGYHVFEKKESQEVLRIGLINLMPKKIETETQFARVLSNTVVNVELVFIRMESYTPTHVSAEHLNAFYHTWQSLQEKSIPIDGVIITGAPVELLEYEQVDYWEELRGLFAFLDRHRVCTLFVCWSAQAALYAYFDIQKRKLKKKAFGLFSHTLEASNPLFLGFDDSFLVPVSRHTGIERDDVIAVDELQIVSESKESGLYAVQNTKKPHFFLFNHLEYEAETLGNEYARDVEKGTDIEKPSNYFNAEQHGELLHRWRSYATLLHSNWLHICVNEFKKRMNGTRRVVVGIVGKTERAHAIVEQFYKRRDVIETKTGSYIHMTTVTKSSEPAHQSSEKTGQLHSDEELVVREDIDIIVEAHGDAKKGRKLVETALEHGKSVIATNARILAEHGLSIIQHAESLQTSFAFESIVGSGIPVLKTIREALASDHINEIRALLSAPSNMILDTIGLEKSSVTELLQKRNDTDTNSLFGRRYVSGYDTAFKLNVLSCIGFGKNYLIDSMPIYGIEKVNYHDIVFAERYGYRIQLSGHARDEGDRVTAWVGPSLHRRSGRFAQVDNAHNALHCISDAVGDLFLQGTGTGVEPAANAALSDLVDVLVNRSRSSFGVPASEIPTVPCEASSLPYQWFVRSTQAIPHEILPYTRQERFEEWWFLFTEKIPIHRFLELCPPEVMFFAPCYESH